MLGLIKVMYGIGVFVFISMGEWVLCLCYWLLVMVLC